MPDEPPIRIGLRVDNVVAATELYESFGFTPFATIPDEAGNPAIVILRRGPLQLLVDALHGLPFPDSPREHQTKTGPRGLGMIIGLEVDDVDEAATHCANCHITAGPVDAPGANAT
ncbi:MAG TPA: hypothetical protein VGN81_27120 [Pseudonocardiaceae bacterium]|jgi:PhnB protein